MNLASVLLARAGSDPSAVALYSDTGTVTYGELDERSGRLAREHLDRLDAGTRVGIVAGNGIAFVVAYLAALRAGTIAVPLDPTSPPAELEADMQAFVDSYACEWKQAIESPEILKRFRHFVNSDEPDSNVVFVAERAQIRPARPEERETDLEHA